MKIPIGVQLYTVREEMQKDFIGTLKKIKEIGYEGVELAGYGGFTAEQLKEHLAEIGLRVTGSHIKIERLQDHLEEEIAYNKALKNEYLVCPWLKWEDEEECLLWAKKLNEIGKRVKEAGLQLCYHNHAHELKKINGRYGLDIFFEALDSELVKAEVDTFWIQHGGLDPQKYLKQYQGRCPLIHIKDMKDKESKAFAAVGEGIMDMEGIIKTAMDIGTKWIVVENDQPVPTGLVNIEQSMKNLQQMDIKL